MAVQKSCQKLKKAFLSLFLTTEAEKIRVADILESSGVSKATFYAHYENLDQLALDVIDTLFRELDDTIEKQHQKDTPAQSDFVLLSEWVTKNQALLAGFCRTPYRAYLRSSLYDYLSSIILYHQKLLSGNLEYPPEQSRFFANAYIGGVFDGLDHHDEDWIRKNAELLETAVQHCSEADLSADKRFYPFRNTSRQCLY